MKRALRYLAIILVALVIGIGSALWVVHSPPESGMVKNGAWRTSLEVGSTHSGMYTRAVVAVTGLFALNKSETIYYIAETDDEGQPLRSVCDYRIRGKDLDTRWWSITAYGEDYFLIPNDQDRYSCNMMNLSREADGRYNIYLSSTPKKVNWLPTGNQGKFSLSLRLYQPASAFYETPQAIELPRIIKEGCR